MLDLSWKDPEKELPKAQDTIGSSRSKDSEIVLVFVGENSYSYRECTLGYFDHKNRYWVFVEDYYSALDVIYWSYLPTSKDFENINQGL